jgi:hypothetical protein
VILKKPTFLLIVLSLVLTLVLAVPAQTAKAWPSYCPVGYTRVGYYNWDGSAYVQEDGIFNDPIVFTNATAQSGWWQVRNPPYSSLLIYLVVLTDGQSYLTYTYSYPNGTAGPQYFQINWNPPHAISNIAFCVPNTPVTLSSFTARTSHGSVNINWATATEVGTAGFLLYRSSTPDGSQAQITPNLLAAQGNEVTGASYSVTDTPGYGTFYYWLKNVDFSGQSSLHGPVLVKVLPAIRLPALRPSLPGQ